MHSISIHIAVLTILLIVIVPLLNDMQLPNRDLSMHAWVQILADYHSEAAASPTWQREIGEFETFYDQLSYGPYLMCDKPLDSEGECGKDGNVWEAPEESPFETPLVEASRLTLKSGALEAAFDFTQARENEAISSSLLIIFAVFLMGITSLFVSMAVSDLVLRPLQRMLKTVKEIAKPILGNLDNLGLTNMASSEGEEEPDGDDEIATLEAIMQKLTKIAGIAVSMSTGQNQIVDEDMQHMMGEDRGILQMVSAGPKTTWKGPSTFKGENTKLPHYDIDPYPGRELLSKLEALSLSFDELDSWEFAVVKLERKMQTNVAGWIILQNAAVFEEVELLPEVTAKFLLALSNTYRTDIAFHTWMHAVDITHSAWRFMLQARAHAFFNGLAQFSLLVAAIGHDVGHPGVNNQFLLETGHELAVRYNDRSPLENMHAATMFLTAATVAGANLFGSMAKQDFFECRRMVIDAILHTDMMHHFEMVKDTNMLFQMNVDEEGQDPAKLFSSKETQQKIMNLYLHFADVSNSCKPWSICQDWAGRVLEEFFQQGDQERQLGIPLGMLNDRTKVNRPFSQIGFIEFMIVPLVACKVKLFPSLFENAELLSHNLQEWNKIWVEEVGPSDEERDKVAARVTKAGTTLTDAKQAGLVFWATVAEDEAPDQSPKNHRSEASEKPPTNSN